MELEQAIRTRRTQKVFGDEPVEPALLRELIELATWAPNHHLTNPWRFRVLGPQARARLEAAAGEESAAKLRRAPTLVAVTSLRSPEDVVVEQEDLLATGSAVYALLLAAHDRGLAAYWRTPGLLRYAPGREALGIGANEEFVALVYMGPPRQDSQAPDRAPLDQVLIQLD